MLRVAAVGDLHYCGERRHHHQEAFAQLSDKADLLLLAGDLTQTGAADEIDFLIEDLSPVTIPTFAVLGNHDYHSNEQVEIIRRLTESGINVLEEKIAEGQIGNETYAIVGLKGFIGGFDGALLHEFGEPEMKNIAAIARVQAENLEKLLNQCAGTVDYRLVLMHYSPAENTLTGEHPGLFPLMGSSLFGRAIDVAGADGAFHGHAHGGTEQGNTPSGISVWNVAQPVINESYKIYEFTR